MRTTIVVIIFAVISLANVAVISAQDEDVCAQLASMAYGDVVEGEITDAEYFDAYCFSGNEGDFITIEVTAETGDLDTVLRLWDPAIETMFAENDDQEEGDTDSLIEFQLPATGQYVILISRYEFETGDTTGEFELSLSVERRSSGGTKQPGKADVSDVITITCDTGETVYGGMQFGFVNIVPGYSYTVTVFGIDDFDPVIAVETEPGIGLCNDDEPDAGGSVVAIPGEGSLRATRLTSQLRFSLPRAGNPVITVGSFNGQGGQFAMVIEGLAITPSTELDGFVIRVPEAVSDEAFSVYMISRYANLDPYLQVGAGEGLEDAFGSNGVFDSDFIDYDNVFIIAECDDAGSTTCEETPALPGGGIDIANGRTFITGSFDAGIQLVPETTEPFLYVFGSYDGASSGEYAILILGNVPDVEID